MNDVYEALMSSYPNMSRDFRLESKKGYAYVGMIDAAFSLINDISNDFEAGIYFFQPDSKLLELKSFTSEIFIDSLSLENYFIAIW